MPSRVDKKKYEEFATSGKIYKSKGCEKCGGFGYRGRISIFELFVVNETLEKSIYGSPTEIELKNLAKNQEMVTLQEDGILKIVSGITSVEEVEKVTGTTSLFH